MAHNATVKYFREVIGANNSAPTTDSVLVNGSGIVQVSKFNLKDMNDVYYVTDKQGKVVYAGYNRLYTTPGNRTNSFTFMRDGKTVTVWTE